MVDICTAVYIFLCFIMAALRSTLVDADVIYFCPVFLSSFFLSSPNISGRRLDVCHTSTHGVALVQI